MISWAKVQLRVHELMHYYKNDLWQCLLFFVGAALYWAAPTNGCQMSRPYKWICRGGRCYQPPLQMAWFVGAALYPAQYWSVPTNRRHACGWHTSHATRHQPHHCGAQGTNPTGRCNGNAKSSAGAGSRRRAYTLRVLRWSWTRDGRAAGDWPADLALAARVLKIKY